MTSDVEIIKPDATVQEAARRMRDLNVGSLPVCDGNRVLGIISDRDITLRVTAEGTNPGNVKVRDVMSPNIVYCYEDQDVDEAGEVMGYNQIRRLPILNREKKLVGIISLGDISTDANNDRLSGKTLKDISVPSSPRTK
jgi:CBS domain-containing protein